MTMKHTDYRYLLKKYMMHIIEREGRDYVEQLSPEYEPEIEFTINEFKAMESLSEEIDKEFPRLPIKQQFSLWITLTE